MRRTLAIVALGDLDCDGDLDAFVVNSGHPNIVWTNDGNGAFTNSGQALGASGSLSVALGDLDGDGDLDAMVTNCCGQANTVWIKGSDRDADGVPDQSDGCPDDPNKTEPGDCGCGVVDTNVYGDIDCDGDYDEDDIRLGMADFGITEGNDPVAGDADGDGDVDADDRTAVNDALGLCAADIDGDGQVDGADLSYVLGYWGLCSAP